MTYTNLIILIRVYIINRDWARSLPEQLEVQSHLLPLPAPYLLHMILFCNLFHEYPPYHTMATLILIGSHTRTVQMAIYRPNLQKPQPQPQP